MQAIFRAASLTAFTLALAAPAAARAQTWTKYEAPPVVRSDPTTHLLNTKLTVMAADVSVGGKQYRTNLYNGLLQPPVLELEPGDSLRVRLVNATEKIADNVTNLHFHGFAVSPVPPADNVTSTHVAPGDTFQYAMRLPGDHAQGLFWYHPHAHGTSYDQVRRGMSGAISIGDPRRFFARPIRDAPAFYLLLKEYEPADTTLSTVNGVEAVQLPDLRVGQVQVWRIANISTERYYRLQVKGPTGRVLAFRTLARDGNVVRDGDPVMDTTILLGAGQRAEIAVSPTEPGMYTLATGDFVRQQAEGLAPLLVDAAANLARVNVLPAAAGAGNAAPLAGRGGQPREADILRRLASLAGGGVVRDTVEFEIIREPNVRARYLVDSLAYDPARIDKVLRMGQAYEWTITNPSPSWHPFHIHQTDFLVVRADTVPMRPDYRVDTVNVPPHSSAVIRFVYERPETAGNFVYHCHVLFHEDQGMMANVVLEKAGAAAAGGGHSGSHP